MSEERLKEIKDSISYAHRISCDPAISMDFRDKEDLYYEVIRLKQVIDKAIEYFEYQLSQLDFEKDTMAKMLCAMALVILRGDDK